MAFRLSAAQEGRSFVNQNGAVRKIWWRIIPLLFSCYVVAYLDRVNVGFAGLTMVKDLNLTAAEFGWSSGLFFLGYFIAEIPSNLALQSVGARRWLARIMISWGLISAATSLVSGPVSLGTMRFLLGLGEAGFAPGVLLYFSGWFPSNWRGRLVATFMVGIPVSGVIGAPISSWILSLDGTLGFAGWRWLLLLEGIPAVGLGLACLAFLPDTPATVRWLSAAEREWLTGEIAAEHRLIASHGPSTFIAALTDWRVLMFAAVNFCSLVGLTGISLWMPQILKGFGFANMQVGLLVSLPFGVSAVAMIWWGTRSDRSANRAWFPVIALALQAVGTCLSALSGSSLLEIAMLAAAMSGAMSYQATLWPLPLGMLIDRAAAVGLAIIISVGNLGGFVGPYLIGLMKDETGSFATALMLVAGLTLFGAGMLSVIARSFGQRHQVRKFALVPSAHD
jgi:MFS transporter, ACS family, tartrate transporter